MTRVDSRPAAIGRGESFSLEMRPLSRPQQVSRFILLMVASMC
jgi:hypothetical protein